MGTFYQVFARRQQTKSTFCPLDGSSVLSLVVFRRRYSWFSCGFETRKGITSGSGIKAQHFIVLMNNLVFYVVLITTIKTNQFF